MKKFKLFLLLFAAAVASVGFTSCNDDDDDAASIVGSWLYVESDETWSEIMTFTTDGMFIDQSTYNGYTSTETATYTYDGTILTIYFEDGADQVTAIVSGDTMIFDQDEVFIRM